MHANNYVFLRTFSVSLRAFSIILLALIINGPVNAQGIAIKDLEATYKKAQRNLDKDPESSMALAQEVVELSNSPLLKAKAMNLLGGHKKNEKNYGQAAQYHREAFELSQAVRSDQVAIQSLCNLADVLRYAEQFEEALQQVALALELAEDSQLFERQVEALNVQGNIYKSANRHEASLQSFLQALVIVDEYNFDSLRLGTVNHIAHAYKRLEKFDKAIAYKSRALAIAEKIDNYDTVELVKHLGDLAELSRKVGDNVAGLKYALQGLSLLPEDGRSKVEQRILVNLTIIYRRLSVYDASLEYAIQLKKSYEINNDINGIVSTNLQTAMIYDHLEQYDNAEEFYRKALEVPIEISKAKYHGSANRGIASILRKRGNYQEALEYAERAKKIFEDLGSKSGKESSSRLLAQIYASLGDVEKSLAIFNDALQQSKKLGDTWSEASNLVLMGKLLMYSRPDEAWRYTEEGIAIAEAGGAKSIAKDGYDVLMKMSYTDRQYKAAYEYAQSAKILGNEINKENISKRVADLKVVNEIYEKEREIEILERNARINALEAIRQEERLQILNEEKTISDLQLKRENYMRVFLLAITIFSLLVIFVVFGYFKIALKSQAFVSQSGT